MITKQLQRCYKDLSDLFSHTNDADEMNAIIKIKDLLIGRIKYRESFEKAFKNHTPTDVGEQINKTGGRPNGNYNNKNRKEKNIQRL